MTTAAPSYKGHRYPVEIINHCVWLYFRFPLRFREVEELMLVRGAVVLLGLALAGRSSDHRTAESTWPDVARLDDLAPPAGRKEGDPVSG